jgi:hypothetical protein
MGVWPRNTAVDRAKYPDSRRVADNEISCGDPGRGRSLF